MILLVLIQFIQPVRNKSNVLPATDLVTTISVPQNVQRILRNACYDCHSNNTNYPWYSRIQPFGWSLARHIKKGKAQLNFNEFGLYNRRRKISKLNAIANSIRDETMPLESYALMHKRARLSSEDKTLIIDWVTGKKDSLRLTN